ncbi:MAG TPA: N-acetylmuramoyl-L-alanine amidase, partial [Chloroflexia bacterium]|nr:N-acetylmuramoyl-L-alanine amidase [Chloroflexia bacterium]
QYFERARFEWHPENQGAARVLLGLLGRTATAGREHESPFQPAPARDPARYFAPTQHNLAPEFATYWQTYGGLAIYGYPISEPFQETSPTDGHVYLVQYFERNRLEFHPELPAAYRVSLGLLGVDVLRARGWIP